MESLEFILCSQNFGLVLISEMAGYNRDCLSILTFNPYSQNEYNQKINLILETSDEIISYLLTNEDNNLRKNNTLIWMEGILSTLKKVRIQTMQYFPKLDRDNSLDLLNEVTSQIQLTQFKNDYRKSSNRLIVLDYNWTLFTLDSDQLCPECLAE